MSLIEDLSAVLTIAEQPLSRLDILTQHIPVDWIQTAAALSTQASIRRRRLPSAGRWGYERYPDDQWHGLQVFVADGALFRTQDTPELRAHFGSGNTSTDRQTP